MGGKFDPGRVIQEMKQVGDVGLSLRFRLFGFFVVFLITIMLGVMIILVASGTFRTGQKELYALLNHEHAIISTDVNRDFGNISVQGVELARTLSHNLENSFSEWDISADSLQEHPQLLESLLDKEVGLLTISLEKAQTSGVFLILDATVNPMLDSAENSRAGIFIKNMEPNIVSSTFANLRLLRGPMEIAKNNDLFILPQWQMEFEVGKGDAYNKVLETAQASALPLSRLYYWEHGSNISFDTESAMYCCVPLRDSRGRVFGICGFEVSSMLFKLSYSPTLPQYNSLFSLFSPLESGNLQGKGALLAGNYLPKDLSDQLGIAHNQPFNTYQHKSGTAFTGLHRAISLYPMDSAYQDQWLLVLMMPERDFAQYISWQNKRLLLFLILLLLTSIGLSYLISRKYIQPVVATINLIKEDKISQVPKTRIPEIDDLVRFLAEQDEAADLASTAGSAKTSPMFHQFLENVETLSQAERSVFDLYLKGYTAREIADTLYLSINTIKTHNKRIYMKLNISSRKELLLYAQMLEEQKSM